MPSLIFAGKLRRCAQLAFKQRISSPGSSPSVYTSHTEWVLNSSPIEVDIWLNGGGPVARVKPNQKERLRCLHVDPATSGGKILWRATHTIPGQCTLEVASGNLGREPVVIRAETFCGLTVANLIAIIKLQAAWRAKLKQSEAAHALLADKAALTLQRHARGRIARVPATCFICLSDMPFRSMVSLVARASCHRCCFRCASAYTDKAIDSGRLFIRCPGEGCTHLIEPEAFASETAKSKYRAALLATHKQRLTSETDKLFLGFCREHARACPACGVVIWRSAGCDHMSCRCGHEFNWGAAEARIDQATQTIAYKIVSIPGNSTCFDCGADCRIDPWTSLSFGTVICLKCAGVHRSLGVHISFVRSLQLDGLKEEEMSALQMRGNYRLREFLASAAQGVTHDAWDAMSIEQRYKTPSAAEYRQRLKADKTQRRVGQRARLRVGSSWLSGAHSRREVTHRSHAVPPLSSRTRQQVFADDQHVV
eukprot:CAMPEP_0119334708 /NCGR_PEP_ID=MMETSP1333-20130426/87871_1 /TAXON_ID=418940 /ORGANISM="Scyphosphaera apsteinii, Strain RCC1455" /LENGTH=480 /DNA_ID=CAMNT_0007345067 /DNA_START=65 /DNA_END=1503 /DNA_ORIENTATION=-